MTDDEQEQLFLNVGTTDEYLLGKIGFVPDVVYDIGADVGSVTTLAHRLYPSAKIVAVEPNPWSYPRLAKRFQDVPQVIPIRAAVGVGPLYEPIKAEPLHWLVVGREAPTWNPAWPLSDVPAVMLDELYAQHGGERYVVKMDCESAEQAVVTHEPSRKMIFGSAYFCAEFHFWGHTHDKMLGAIDDLTRFLFWLGQTHTIYTYSYGACMHVWAKRRGADGVVPFLSLT